MSELGTPNQPLRVAVVGAGPSGFYAADALFKSDKDVQVDCFDRLPSPFGLLRGGVAPDHQKMKSIGAYYQRVADKNREHFRFFGNVEVGKDITVEELQSFYDAIVFTYGAETDKKLWVDGESLERSYTATEFVGWYNGHPDYREHNFDLSQENVAIIGQGNVAVDVARILAKTNDELKTSDIAQHALDALNNSGVKNIYMIGRRGPVQVAFTKLEIEELGKLEDCDIVIDPKDLELSATDQEELELPENNKARKNYEVMLELSKKPIEGKSKKIILRFFQSPLSFNGDKAVESITMEINEMSGEAGAQKVRGTGVKEELPCGLIFRSIGYKGLPLNGLPFNEKAGVVPNEKGRIIDENNQPITGLYTAGWIKRGATGVLGTNKKDAEESIKCLLEDLDALPACENRNSDALLKLLTDRDIRVVTYDDWTLLDKEEVKRGEAVGKPREKFTRVSEFIDYLENISIPS